MTFRSMMVAGVEWYWDDDLNIPLMQCKQASSEKKPLVGWVMYSIV